MTNESYPPSNFQNRSLVRNGAASRLSRRLSHCAYIGVAAAIQMIIVPHGEYLLVCLIAVLASIVVTLLCKGGRLFVGVLLIPGTLYALGPYFAAGSGARLWPFPGFNAYVQSMAFMICTLYLATGFVAALGLHLRVARRIPESIEGVLSLSRSRTAAFLSALVCVVLGMQAWYVYFTGPTGGAGRRESEHLFWAAGSLTGQVLAIVCSVLILAPLITGLSRHLLPRVAIFAGLWAPFLLGGGRRLLVYVAVPIFLAAFSVGGKRLKGSLGVVGLAGLAWFALVPVIFPDGGAFAAHGEWSISGAPFVALFVGALDAASVGASTWPANIVRALPDFLGGGSAVPLADALVKTDLYPAGTSGSPWSDAWDGSIVTSALWFISIVLVITVVLLGSERVSPGALVFGLASLSIFGRTHAPYAIMTILFPVLLILLFKFLGRLIDNEQASSPSQIK